MDKDRNLLFGILAVQLRKVTPDQLVKAAALWAAHPDQPLAERLLELGAIDQHDRRLLDNVVGATLDAHDGDASASLRALGGEHAIYASFHGSVVREGDSWKVREADSIEADSFLESSVSVREVPGRYEEISEQGRGGMGRVLLVHDEAIGRDIVLKELLPDDPKSSKTPGSPVRRSASLMARFLQEAKITGQLEHPAVAPVYELGYRADGSLYYTMKLVRGRTLSEAFDGAQSLRQRLELLPHFVDLCQALAYAHSRGVIHRDLKPANIMIGEFGETVVLDWGLAKVKGRADAQGDQLEATLKSWSIDEASSREKTAPGDVLGTPLYMAPEQARGEIDRIDQKTDIYGLGVILYHLLTGETPFPWTNAAEVLRQVASEMPPTVEEREADAPPELAAICRRAMQRDPKDRYASAKELADDVARYQSGAMVKAYEYGLGEHVLRFVQRNRAILATSAAAVVALIGLGVYSYIRVSIERTDAILARDEAQEQRSRAQENYAKSRDNFRAARAAVDDLLTNVSENVLFHTPGVEPVRKELLELALHYYEGFIANQAREPGLEHELALSYARVGHINQELGQPEVAATAFGHAAAVFEDLIASNPDNSAYLSGLVNAQRWQGWNHYFAGDSVAAFTVGARAIENVEILATQFPDDSEVQALLAESLVDAADIQVALGNFPDAETICARAVSVAEALNERYPESQEFKLRLARAYDKFAEILSRTRKPDQSLVAAQNALRVLESSVTDEADQAPDTRNSIAESHRMIGDVHLSKREFEAARDAYALAADIYSELVEQFPSMIPYKQGYAMVHRQLGRLAYAQRKLPEAIEHERDAVALGEDILARSSTSMWSLFWFSDDLIYLSQWLALSMQIPEAIGHLQRVIELNKPFASTNPNLIWPMGKIRWSYDLLAQIYSRTGRHEEALASQEEFITYTKALAERFEAAQGAESQKVLAQALNSVAWTLLTGPETLQDAPRALEYAKEAAERSNFDEAAILDTLGLAYFQNGDVEAAIEAQEKALSMLPDDADSAMRKELTDRLEEFREAAQPVGQ